MKIEHIAIWTKQLEVLKRFYEDYFGATSNSKYHNPTKGFSSYFLSFETGSRLEIMEMDSVPESISMISMINLPASFIWQFL